MLKNKMIYSDFEKKSYEIIIAIYDMIGMEFNISGRCNTSIIFDLNESLHQIIKDNSVDIIKFHDYLKNQQLTRYNLLVNANAKKYLSSEQIERVCFKIRKEQSLAT